MRKTFITFSLILLIYMIWPGPTKISDFKKLPDSVKSQLSGDTWQVPNVVAYFSNNFRGFVTPFYRNDYQSLSYFPFPPLRLNHPPEFSWLTIKKHTDSTYLEEFVYPLRDSLYVNGFEPFYEDGLPKWWGAAKFVPDDSSYFTKTTLRFYPSPVWVRIIVWLGILISTLAIYKLGKKIIF